MEARTVALLGRHPLWLEAIKQVVRALEADVVASASTVEALLPVLRHNVPHVLLIEDHVDVTETDMITCLGRIRDEQPMMSVIVVSGSDDPNAIVPVLAAGAFACILRTAEPGDIAAAIRQAFERSFYLLTDTGSSAAAGSPRHAGASLTLTARERDVLELVGGGCSNVEIAERLTLCISTVKAHLSRIYEKLGARNRTEAVLRARLAGTIGAPQEAHRARTTGRR